MSLFWTRAGSSACSFSACRWFSSSAFSKSCVVSSARTISILMLCSCSCRSWMGGGVPCSAVCPPWTCSDSHWLIPTWAWLFWICWFWASCARSMSRRFMRTRSSKFCMSSRFHLALSSCMARGSCTARGVAATLPSSGTSWPSPTSPPSRLMLPGGFSGRLASFTFRSVSSPWSSFMISVYLETWCVTLTTFLTALVLMFLARFAYFSVL
mmetsp:Transcript_24509/g.62218  ORF Transcript_24509/g.62218 Transcript_24509/m.62218 type:complete len:211 (-) Transcript_24509:583-1215(-)